MAEQKPMRGDIWFADLGESTDFFDGQRGKRPCLIVSNDKGNSVSPCAIAALMTTKQSHLPVFVRVTEDDGSNKTGFINCANIITVDLRRLSHRLGRLSNDAMERVDQALRIEFDLE